MRDIHVLSRPSVRFRSVLASGATVAFVVAGAGAAFAGGTIAGKVTLKGKAPEAKPLNMSSDPFCSKQGVRKDEEVVTAADGGLKNVVVRITKGVKTPVPPPETPAVLDQNGCTYSPRVLVAQAGQQVNIKNSDQTLHNVRGNKGAVSVFNNAQPQGFAPLKKKFEAGDVVKLKCDVHPWMTAWVVVNDNPYFSVSGDDGTFSIKDVPPGKYTVEVWHEKLGTQTKDVTVAEGKTAELKLEVKSK